MLMSKPLSKLIKSESLGGGEQGTGILKKLFRRFSWTVGVRSLWLRGFYQQYIIKDLSSVTHSINSWESTIYQKGRLWTIGKSEHILRNSCIPIWETMRFAFMPHICGTLHCVVNIEELALSKISQILPSNVLIVKEVNLKIRDRWWHPSRNKTKTMWLCLRLSNGF